MLLSCYKTIWNGVLSKRFCSNKMCNIKIKKKINKLKTNHNTIY